MPTGRIFELVVIVGESEMQRKVTIKNMDTGNQEPVKIGDIGQYIETTFHINDIQLLWQETYHFPSR